MLQLEQVAVRYGRVSAVTHLSLTVVEGEIVALVGANGAGKSSTMKAILGLVEATGEIRLHGTDIVGYSTAQRVAAGVALSPEGRHVFSDMTVRDNLELGLVARTRANGAELMEEMFELFPRLRERSRQMAGSLSGGEQQMLAIARALMSRPSILMLDEPTLGLAPIVVDQISELIQSLKARGMGIILAEQNAEMALANADRAYVMETGRIVKEGPSTAIAKDTTVRQAYLGL